MRDDNENKKKKIIIVLLILTSTVFGLVIAYSALTATLHITFGTIVHNSVQWNVGFEPGIITPNKFGSQRAECGEANVTVSTVSISYLNLSTLHDKCVYKLKVQNLGTLDALLTSVAAKTPASASCDTSSISKMVCGNITYKLTTDPAGLSLLDVDRTLNAQGGTLELFLFAEYSGITLGEETVQNTGGFTLNYLQK